ncbi:hypothetical protein ACQP1K_13125 [Sphaerimonospora sp. CA-214678]|uniref:hypothetical protein n=1 Tax=Sphaerimonospora sp. CA-214678 TaxID=3240029 RepID=UPI003D8F5026
MTHPSNEEIPLRRFAIDELVKDVAGARLPDDDEIDEHLAELLDEVSLAIPGITFEKDAKGEAGRVHFSSHGPKITFDPKATLGSGHADPQTFRTAALLHEVMHVICDHGYEKPPVDGLYGRNFHIDRNAADDDAIGESLRKQQDIADANYARAVAKLEADRSKVISENIRKYLGERFVYGRAQPDVHYDSVLFELLVYLTLHRAQETPTFRYLRSLSVEATDRRNARPASIITHITA